MMKFDQTWFFLCQIFHQILSNLIKFIQFLSVYFVKVSSRVSQLEACFSFIRVKKSVLRLMEHPLTPKKTQRRNEAGAKMKKWSVGIIWIGSKEALFFRNWFCQRRKKAWERYSKIQTRVKYDRCDVGIKSWWIFLLSWRGDVCYILGIFWYSVNVGQRVIFDSKSSRCGVWEITR